MRRLVRNSSLSLFFLVLLLLSLVFLAIVGHDLYNDDEATHAELNGETPQLISLGRYLFSSHFGHAVMENWQSEYLQFSLMILATVWFIQRGSTESKEPAKAGAEWRPKTDDRRARTAELAEVGEGARDQLSGSTRTPGARDGLDLLLVVVRPVDDRLERVQRRGRRARGGDRCRGSATSAARRFWFDTLQNWQSEFLAVGSMAVFSIWLRQRGSPESKPVGAPHTATGVEG